MSENLQVRDVDESAERRRWWLTRGAAGAAAVLLVAGAAAAAWYLAPPAMPETIEEATALVESRRFQRLSNLEKQPYHDVIREQFGSLDRQQRRAMRQENEALAEAAGEGWARQMKAMAIAYANADEAERARMEAGFRAMRPRGERPRNDGERQRPRGDGGNGGDDGNDPDRRNRVRDHINDRLTNGDAQMNQLFGEFMKEMVTKQQN